MTAVQGLRSVEKMADRFCQTPQPWVDTRGYISGSDETGLHAGNRAGRPDLATVKIGLSSCTDVFLLDRRAARTRACHHSREDEKHHWTNTPLDQSPVFER